MRPNLVLKKEALTELTPEEMSSVAGGWTPWCPFFIELTEMLDEIPSLRC